MPDVYDGFGFSDTITAGEDLSASAKQYKAIELDGTLANDTDTAIGILMNKPKSGEAAQVKMLGKMMGYAGAALAAKDLLKVTTSGYIIKCASGDRVAPIGKNLNAAVASGDLFTFFGNFINAGAVKVSSY